MYKNKKETKKENKEVLLDNVCVCVCESAVKVSHHKPIL